MINPASLLPVILLAGSGIVMNVAWYYHLKQPSIGVLAAIGLAWGIALIEYCLAVPANRIGHQVYSAAELKTMQEVITLIVFAVFSVTFLGEKLTMNHAVGFALIIAGAWFVFRGPL